MARSKKQTARKQSSIFTQSAINKYTPKQKQKLTKNKNYEKVSGLKRAVGNYKVKRAKNVLKQIKQLQKRTDVLIPKAAFRRLVKSIIDQNTQEGMRVQENALAALQQAGESALIERLQHANKAAQHAKRQTINTKDMNLPKEMCDSAY